MKHIYLDIPEAPDVAYVILRQLPGFLLENRLALRGYSKRVVRLESVDPHILCWLREQHKQQYAVTQNDLFHKLVDNSG